MQARCPTCDTLQQVTQTGVAVKYRTDSDFSRIPDGRTCYWRICNHKDENGESCEGSGKRV